MECRKYGWTFKALSYTKPRSSGEVAPLYREDRTLATGKAEQAKLLFHGTSSVTTPCNLSDIPVFHPAWDDSYPPVKPAKVETIIQKIPNKKAAGPEKIPNELIKLAKSSVGPFLSKLFDACLNFSYFPTEWRKATTAIMHKFDKADYSEPGAY